MKTISYEAKISFMKEAKDIFRQENSPNAIMMCEVIIEDLVRLRDLE